MGFNFGNLVGAAVGAIVKVAVAIVNSIAEAVLGALAAVAEACEDGELNDEQAEELFEEKFKALLGAYMLSIQSGSSSSTSNSDNKFKLPTYTPGAWGTDGNRNTSVNVYKDGDRVKILAGNGEYFVATVRTRFGGIELEIDDLDGYKEARSTEPPGVVAKVVSNVENKYNNFLNDYQESENSREQANINEYNKVAEYYEELENLEKQSDEMIKQRNAEEAEQLAELRKKHIIVGCGLGVSASDIIRVEGSESVQFNTRNFDWDFLTTTGGGGATNVSVGGGPFMQVTVADNGIPDLYGEGKNTGWTLGLFSVDISTADHAKTYTFNIGGKGVEAHTSETYTYSAKEVVKEKKDEVSKSVDNYFQDKIDQQIDELIRKSK